jgi:hypothetical protein
VLVFEGSAVYRRRLASGAIYRLDQGEEAGKALSNNSVINRWIQRKPQWSPRSIVALFLKMWKSRFVSLKKIQNKTPMCI